MGKLVSVAFREMPHAALGGVVAWGGHPQGGGLRAWAFPVDFGPAFQPADR